MGLNASGIASDPSIWHASDGYRLWFTSVQLAGSDAILETAVATSSDGLAFAAPTDPVLQPSGSGWDSAGVETVSVLRDATGMFRLWYAGDLPPPGSNQYAIGAASSADGIHWTKIAAPVLSPEAAWEQPVCVDPPACTEHFGGVLEPSVIEDANGFTMWYAALGEQDSVVTYRIGRARSSDGVTWTHDPAPVLLPGAAGSFDDALVSHVDVVADPGGGYHMFYFGSSQADAAACTAAGGCAMTPGAIGHAFSSDGIAWTRDAAPVLVPRAGDLDAWTLGGPSALIEDGEMRVYYFGNATSSTFAAGFARARASCEQQ